MDAGLAWDEPVAGVQFNRVTFSSDEGDTVWWVRSEALHLLELEDGFEAETAALAERSDSDR